MYLRINYRLWTRATKLGSGTILESFLELKITKVAKVEKTTRKKLLLKTIILTQPIAR